MQYTYLFVAPENIRMHMVTMVILYIIITLGLYIIIVHADILYTYMCNVVVLTGLIRK